MEDWPSFISIPCLILHLEPQRHAENLPISSLYDARKVGDFLKRNEHIENGTKQ